MGRSDEQDMVMAGIPLSRIFFFFSSYLHFKKCPSQRGGHIGNLSENSWSIDVATEKGYPAHKCNAYTTTV